MSVQAYGWNGSSFVVKVVCSDNFGWRVSTCDTRLSAAMNDDVSITVQAQAGVVTEGVTVHDDDNVICEEGTADNNDDTVEDNTDTNKSVCTLFKSRWLIPLLKTAISETPNMPNKQIKLLIAPYIKEKF